MTILTRPNFGRSEVAVILFLTATLLIGSAILIYQKSRQAVRPELVVEYIKSSDIPRTSRNNSSRNSVAEQILQSRKININSAPADSFELIPGIGPALANSIVSYRNEHGPFESIDDIVSVYGIGPSTLKKIRPFITAGSE